MNPKSTGSPSVARLRRLAYLLTEGVKYPPAIRCSLHHGDHQEEAQMRRCPGRSTAIAVAAALVAAGAPARADEGGVKAGYLKCRVAAGVSFFVGSSRDLSCTYTTEGAQRVDRYVGEIKRFGLDIGFQDGGTILWGVIAPTKDVGPGALAGDYAGATAAVAAGYGGGANVLIGGGAKSIALQPLSVQGIEGMNLAAGIGVLSLRAVGK
jgi:hypothetical protein